MSETLPPPLPPQVSSPAANAVPNAMPGRPNDTPGRAAPGGPVPSVRKGSSAGVLAAIAGGCAAGVVAVAAVAWFALRVGELSAVGEPSAGDRKTVRVEGVEIALRWCPTRSLMKIDEDDETPLPVSLAKGFWMGETEVTQAQWEAVMGENPSKFKGADNPVERVSWDDCQEFLKKLNALAAVKKAGLTFQLPTEEEWEAVCRAGAEGDYCKLADSTEITESTLGRAAWFSDNSDEKPHPVGQKKPNAFGLYDMLGNVVEWTSTADGEFRVCRGGGWDFPAFLCKSSVRDRLSPSDIGDLLGFRLCASGKGD